MSLTDQQLTTLDLALTELKSSLTHYRLNQVIAPKKRLEEGFYGDCSECGENIAYPRLEAYPEADLCIQCQAEREAD